MRTAESVTENQFETVNQNSNSSKWLANSNDESLELQWDTVGGDGVYCRYIRLRRFHRLRSVREKALRMHSVFVTSLNE